MLRATQLTSLFAIFDDSAQPDVSIQIDNSIQFEDSVPFDDLIQFDESASAGCRTSQRAALWTRRIQLKHRIELGARSPAQLGQNCARGRNVYTYIYIERESLSHRCIFYLLYLTFSISTTWRLNSNRQLNSIRRFSLIRRFNSIRHVRKRWVPPEPAGSAADSSNSIEASNWIGRAQPGPAGTKLRLGAQCTHIYIYIYI